MRGVVRHRKKLRSALLVASLRLGMALAWVACAGLAEADAKPPATRPNFVFILVDDMGYGDLSCFGGKPALTPHLDNLASEGIRFSQFYVGSPICSPSRTAFTTGQQPARWRITSYLASRSENERRGLANWLDPKAPTLARELKKAGYATGHFGKWHMGGQRDVGEAPLITEYGFDESLTQFEGLGDRILPLLDDCKGEPPRKYCLGSDQLGRGNIEWMDRSKVTGAFVQRAIQFIEQAQKKGLPFYVNLWPDDVHSPFFPPKDLRQSEAKRELYLAVTQAMDRQLAELFGFISKNPSLRTNTIILVASDNGPEPGAGSAGPFRGHKGQLYEGGIRTSLIVWGPGYAKPSSLGSVNKTTVVSALDFFPSLASIARVRLPSGQKFDGEDMSQALLGWQAPTRSKPLLWTRPPDRPGDEAELWPDLAVRQGQWKLLQMRDGSEAELYDLANDPGEQHNLASKHPEVVRRLGAPLLAWWNSLPGEKHQVGTEPSKKVGSTSSGVASVPR